MNLTPDESRQVAEVIRTSAIATARKILDDTAGFRITDDAQVREIDGDLYLQIWLRFAD